MNLRTNYRTIIDGYNLIFQCGLEGRSRDSMAIERARSRLNSTLAGWLDEDARRHTAIVFDAETLPIKEEGSVSVKNEMTIIFAVEYDEADTLIEEMIQQHSSPKQLTVVSSDHRLHKAALRRKATPIDSDVWFDWVEQERVAGRASLPQEGADKLDVEKELPESFDGIDWAKEFGVDEP